MPSVRPEVAAKAICSMSCKSRPAAEGLPSKARLATIFPHSAARSWICRNFSSLSFFCPMIHSPLHLRRENCSSSSFLCNAHWSALQTVSWPRAGAIDAGSIAVSGTNVYVGTGEANLSDSRYGTGILVSTNGGDTFPTYRSGATPANEFFRNSISKIINPSTNVLFAAVVPLPIRSPIAPPGNPPQSTWGVYQSTDNGATWAKISGGTTGLPDGSVVTDLDYIPIAGTTCILAAVGNIGGAVNNGVYLRTPQAGGGYSWSVFGGTFPAGVGVGRLALASDHTSTFYVASSTAAGNFNNVSKAVWNGTAWSLRSSVGPAGVTDTNLWYNLALGLSPSGRLYLGMQKSVYESNPGVTIWQTIAGPAGGVSPHVDHHAFAFAPDGTVYEGDDGGCLALQPRRLRSGDHLCRRDESRGHRDHGFQPEQSSRSGDGEPGQQRRDRPTGECQQRRNLPHTATTRKRGARPRGASAEARSRPPSTRRRKTRRRRTSRTRKRRS